MHLPSLAGKSRTSNPKNIRYSTNYEYAHCSSPAFCYFLSYVKIFSSAWSSLRAGTRFAANIKPVLSYITFMSILALQFGAVNVWVWAGRAQSIQRYAMGWRAGIRFPVVERDFSLVHSAQIGTGAQPAFYPMGTRNYLPGSKAAGWWSWPLTSI
jgi:hypothetical protein